MAIVTGSNSKVTIGTTPVTVASVTSISFSPTAEINKVTAMQDTAQKVLPGTMSFSGSVTVKLDPADTNGQVALINAFINGTSLSFRIYTDIANTHYWSGSGYIKSMPHKIAGGKAITEVEFQYESDGAWTYV
jgi:hypothetical protein